MDNLNIPCQKSLTDYYGGKEGRRLGRRLTVHDTPQHGRGLNQAEMEISLFSGQCLGRRRIPALAALRQEARAWNRQIHRARTKINWKFSRKDARKKFGYRRNHFRRSKT